MTLERVPARSKGKKFPGVLVMTTEMVQRFSRMATDVRYAVLLRETFGHCT